MERGGKDPLLQRSPANWGIGYIQYIQYIQYPCAVRDHSAHKEKVTDITPGGRAGQKQHSVKPGLKPGLNQG